MSKSTLVGVLTPRTWTNATYQGFFQGTHWPSCPCTRSSLCRNRRCLKLSDLMVHRIAPFSWFALSPSQYSTKESGCTHPYSTVTTSSTRFSCSLVYGSTCTAWDIEHEIFYLIMWAHPATPTRVHTRACPHTCTHTHTLKTAGSKLT